MRKLTVIAFLLFSLLLPVMAQAEDDLPEGCDPAGALAEISALLTGGEIEPIDVLLAIRNVVNAAAQDCNDLVFTSSEEGLNPALGPITLDKGVWRVNVETNGTLFMDLMVLDGSCAGTGSLASIGTLFMIVTPGTGTAQTLIDSDGCDALFEFSMMSAGWELSLEKLR